jgi:hypothetical protein
MARCLLKATQQALDGLALMRMAFVFGNCPKYIVGITRLAKNNCLFVKNAHISHFITAKVKRCI